MCRAFRDNHIHRMPIFDEEQNAVLHIATHRRVLKYLVEHMKVDIKLFQHTLDELKIGTWGDAVHSVPFSMKMMDGTFDHYHQY